jgi:hypothetical protein
LSDQNQSPEDASTYGPDARSSVPKRQPENSLLYDTATGLPAERAEQPNVAELDERNRLMSRPRRAQGPPLPEDTEASMLASLHEPPPATNPMSEESHGVPGYSTHTSDAGRPAEHAGPKPSHDELDRRDRLMAGTRRAQGPPLRDDRREEAMPDEVSHESVGATDPKEPRDYPMAITLIKTSFRRCGHQCPHCDVLSRRGRERSSTHDDGQLVRPHIHRCRGDWSPLILHALSSAGGFCCGPGCPVQSTVPDLVVILYRTTAAETTYFVSRSARHCLRVGTTSTLRPAIRTPPDECDVDYPDVAFTNDNLFVSFNMFIGACSAPSELRFRRYFAVWYSLGYRWWDTTSNGSSPAEGQGRLMVRHNRLAKSGFSCGRQRDTVSRPPT